MCIAVNIWDPLSLSSTRREGCAESHVMSRLASVHFHDMQGARVVTFSRVSPKYFRDLVESLCDLIDCPVSLVFTWCVVDPLSRMFKYATDTGNAWESLWGTQTPYDFTQ